LKISGRLPTPKPVSSRCRRNRPISRCWFATWSIRSRARRPAGPAEDLRPLLQGEGVARFRPRADHRPQPGHGPRRIDPRRERTRRGHDAELHAPARL